jgi:hypothetical protein
MHLPGAGAAARMDLSFRGHSTGGDRETMNKRRVFTFIHEVLMKHLLSSTLFVAIVCLAPCASGQEKKDPGSKYYPLKPGTQWTYQIGTVQVTMKVAKIETYEGVLCGLVESSVEGKVVSTEHISSDDKGVYRHSFNAMKASEPLCILKLPPKKDQTWTFDAKIATETVKGTFKSGEESVKVPAGMYKATTSFTTACELNGMKAEFKYWFAPDVGVVKQTMTIGGREIVSELAKFEAPK